MSGAEGTLYVVATPIGNLEDMSARAIATLRSVDRICAEDTRRTRTLLTHFGIAGKHVDSLHAHSGEKRIEQITRALADGEDVAVVTDAGTPVVSDPGEALIRACVDAGLRVVPIPGASAVLAALVASGFGGGGFRFIGFLPREGAARSDAIALVCDTPEAVVMFEAANRVTASLAELARATPERRACVARELTKLHEEIVRDTLTTLAAYPADRWIGECVIVLGPYDPGARVEASTDEELDRRIDGQLAEGAHVKTIAARLAAWSGRPRRDVYERVIERRARSTTPEAADTDTAATEKIPKR